MYIPIELLEIIISFLDIETTNTLIKALDYATDRFDWSMIYSYIYGKYKRITYEDYKRYQHIEIFKHKINNLNLYITNISRGDDSDDDQIPIDQMNIEQLLTVKFLHMYPRDNITKFPQEIGYLINITSLDIGSCFLVELPQEISLLVNLERLWLMYNQLTNPFIVLGTLTKLNFLMMHTNKINKIPVEISKLVDLKCICLGNNLVEYISDELFKLPKLKSVSLYSNNMKLSIIPNNIITSNIEGMYLGGNLITKYKFHEKFGQWIRDNKVNIDF